MKPPVDTVYISQLGRDQLIKLKRQTGIEHYNVLCRWALCASLREESIPSQSFAASAGALAIDWRVLAGNFSEILSAMLAFRSRKDGFGDSPDSIAAYLRFHVHRGLGYLASETEEIGIAAFLRRWGLNENRPDHFSAQSQTAAEC
jgi:DNA sulfur modification protein DndE